MRTKCCNYYYYYYPHRASLKNMPDHGGNRTYDLWNTSPMLCQPSYAVRSVRVCYISEQNLVPSMSIYINFSFDFLGLDDNVYFQNYFANELIRWVVFKPFALSCFISDKVLLLVF